MSPLMLRQPKRKQPLSAASKKKIAKTYAGALLKKVTLIDLIGAGLSTREMGYILAYVHQLGDRLKGGYALPRQDFASIAAYFKEESE